ncbi:MAG: hypothetical protein JWM85_1910, partial [Acidimicrobiaceae bacterium]|nr:hypothetical protein [Acidimicrobiaceae bacterium]
GWTRLAALVLMLLGAVLVPLGAELTWRAGSQPGAHAQPEVAVIERAGDRAAHGHDPYLAKPRTVGVSPSGDSHRIDADSFFPYLPGMVAFGVANTLRMPPELQDARVALVVFTLLVGIGALLASDATLSRRGRVLQFLVVLPSGALPMVTGGDDLPVLALMLLGLVLAQRRRPVAAGLVLGCAGAMKFTAWPLLFLLAFAIRDRYGARAWKSYATALAVVVLPAVAIGMAIGPASFVENVLRFPLGLAKIKSPAASPLLGQVFVTVLPGHKTVITVLLLVLGGAIAVAALVRYPPSSPASAARSTAFVLVLATVLAPATRFGYLMYPANLLVWAYVLDGMTVGAPAPSRARRAAEAAARALVATQVPSSLSNSLSSTALVGVVSPRPANAGEIDGLTGSTTTPTSQ